MTQDIDIDDMEKALDARKKIAVTPLPIGPEHLDEEFKEGWKAAMKQMEVKKD